MNKSHADALKAYLNLLEKNATGPADFSLKEHFAQELISHLPGGTLTPPSYRVAVDATLASMPPEYKNDAVQVAREFFPFLLSDIKTVAAMMRTGGYRGFAEGNSGINGNNIKTMGDLIAKAAEQTYPSHQTAAYGLYLATLRAKSFEAGSIAMRGRIAKALLYLHGDKDIASGNYRPAVDSVMPLLASEEARLYFVQVAREFFHFLGKDPAAQSRINAAMHYTGPGVFD